MRQITAKVTMDRFDRVGSEIHRGLVEVVANTAEEVKSDAQARARVRTGSMRDSIYVQTQAQDGYADAVAAAEADNPGVPVFDPLPPPATDTEALVPVAVAHAERIEQGVHPFMTPAADDNQAVFDYDVRQSIKTALARATKGAGR